MEQYVITISRQFGSMGRSIARELSEILGIEFLDRDIVEATAKRMGLPVSVISDEEDERTESGQKRGRTLLSMYGMPQFSYSVY